VVTGLKPKQCK